MAVDEPAEFDLPVSFSQETHNDRTKLIIDLTDDLPELNIEVRTNGRILNVEMFVSHKRK